MKQKAMTEEIILARYLAGYPVARIVAECRCSYSKLNMICRKNKVKRARYNTPKEKILELYAEGNLRCIDIAKLVNASVTTVRRVLKDNGYTLAHRNKLKPEMISEIERLTSEGVKIEVICNRLGCSPSSVSKYGKKPDRTERNNRIIEMYKAGIKIEYITMTEHVSELTVRKLTAGIPRKSRYLSAKQKALLTELVKDESLTCSQIAARVGCSQPTVSKWKNLERNKL